MPNPDDGNDADKQAFIDQMSTQISHVLDQPGELWSKYEIVSQPSLVFVEPDGSADVRVGALGPQGLQSRVRILLALRR